MIRKILFILTLLFIPSICFGNNTILLQQQQILGMWSAASAGSSATLVFSNGFETPWSPPDQSNNPADWDSFTGIPQSESVIVKVGSVAMLCDASGEYMNYNHSDYTEIWADFWFRADSNSAGHNIFKEYDSGGTNYLTINVQWDDDMVIMDGTTTWPDANGFFDVVDDHYYHVFLHVVYTTGGSEEIEVAINESFYWDEWDYDGSGLTIAPTNASDLDFGLEWSGDTTNYYFDAPRLYQGAGMPSTW